MDRSRTRYMRLSTQRIRAKTAFDLRGWVASMDNLSGRKHRRAGTSEDRWLGPSRTCLDRVAPPSALLPVCRSPQKMGTGLDLQLL